VWIGGGPRGGGGTRDGCRRLLVVCSGAESESEDEDEDEEAEEEVGSESNRAGESDGESEDEDSEICPSSSPSATGALAS